MVGTTGDPFGEGLGQAIRSVHWNTGAPKALALVVVSILQSSTAAPPAALAPVLSVAGVGAFAIMGSVNEAQPGGSGPIENPVTNEMLDAYYQWTPVAAYSHSTTSTVGGSEFWYVTTHLDFDGPINEDTWNLPYPGTDQCGTALARVGAYGGTFFNCNFSARATAAAGGFTMLPSETSGVFNTLESAQYYADAVAYVIGVPVDVGSISNGGGTTTYSLVQRGVFLLNVDAIAKRDAPNGESFPFAIEVSGAAPTLSFTVQAGTYSSKKDPAPSHLRRDFPLSAENLATFDDFPDDNASRTTNGKISGVVTFKPASQLALVLYVGEVPGGGGVG